MKFVDRFRLTSLFTVASLFIVVVLAGWQLSTLSNRFSQYRVRQSFGADLYALKAGALSLARADPMLYETRHKLEQASAGIDALNVRVMSVLPLEERAPFERAVVKNWSLYRQQLESALQIAATDPQDALNIPERAYQSYLAPLVEYIDRLQVHEQQRRADEEAAMVEAVHVLSISVLWPLVAASLAIIVLQWDLGRRFKRQVNAMLEAAERLVRGEFQIVRLPADGQDELAQIAVRLNQFLDLLVEKLHSLGVIRGPGHTASAPPTKTRVKSSVNESDREDAGA